MVRFNLFTLLRVGTESEPESPMKNEQGIELNSRGIPARKRKKNSLIYGADDLVSIPVKSPKKKIVQKLVREPEKSKKEVKAKLKITQDEDDFDDDDELYEHEQMNDNLDKSIDFYEENIDEPESPHPVKTPKKMMVEEVLHTM